MKRGWVNDGRIGWSSPLRCTITKTEKRKEHFICTPLLAYKSYTVMHHCNFRMCLWFSCCQKAAIEKKLKKQKPAEPTTMEVPFTRMHKLIWISALFFLQLVVDTESVQKIKELRKTEAMQKKEIERYNNVLKEYSTCSFHFPLLFLCYQAQ